MKNLFHEFQVPCVFKQFIATAASGWLSVTAGFAFGFSAVLLPALKTDASFPYDEDLASWIASITPLSMMVGCLCAGSLIDRLGRKTGHIALAAISFISWLTIAFATNNTYMLIGRFVTGLSVGSIRPVSLVYLGEITDPKYRSLTLIGPSICLSLGIGISHVLGGYISWTNCCYIYALANLSCLLILLFLKESPLWLISKGRIDEGSKAFKWFRGSGIEAEKELQLVLQRQNEKTSQFQFKDVLKLSFMKPLFTVLVLAGVQFNGANVFSFYAQEMLDVTFYGRIDSFLFMLGTDVVRVGIVVIIFVINKYFPRKIFFMTVNFFCSLSLFVLVAYLLNIEQFVHDWLSITIIVLYIGFGGCAIVLAWSFVPELFPANLRGFGSGIGAASSYFLLFVCVKTSPGVMDNFGDAALYGAFGVLTVINSVILYFVLPETNGRTLQDIEDSYTKNKADVSSL